MIGIFVSYRREDTGGHAGRLAEQLEARFGKHDVFMDIDAISAGEDFEQRITQTLHRAKVTLVLIGDEWLELTGADGRRRIDAPDDYVRHEIAAALARPETTVIPVLVERAEMPAAADLPPDIAELAKRQAVRLGNERWRYDVGQLMRRIDELTASGPLSRPWRAVRRRRGLAGAGVLIAAAAAVAVGLLASSGGTAAATVRVDDIPLSNPLAQFHSASSVRPYVQVQATKPWIELKIHNLSTTTADITRARITVADALRIRPCFTAGGAPLSAVYNTVLPLTKGATIEPVINEQVQPDAIDRFRITFDLPVSAYGEGGVDTWLMRLHVQLLHDAQPTPIDAGYVMLGFNGAPDPLDFGQMVDQDGRGPPGLPRPHQVLGRGQHPVLDPADAGNPALPGPARAAIGTALELRRAADDQVLTC